MLDTAQSRSLAVSAAEERRGLIAQATFRATGRGLRAGAVGAVVVPAALLAAAFAIGAIGGRTAVGLAEWWYVAGMSGAPMLNTARFFLLLGTLGTMIFVTGPHAPRAAWWAGVAGGGIALTLLTGLGRAVADWLGRFAAELQGFL